MLDPNELQQGTEVVTSIVTGLEASGAQQRPGANPTNNPLMGPQRGPGPGRRWRWRPRRPVERTLDCQ